MRKWKENLSVVLSSVLSVVLFINLLIVGFASVGSGIVKEKTVTAFLQEMDYETVLSLPSEYNDLIAIKGE